MPLFQGFGIGLRSAHYPVITESWPDRIDWFEAISENYMDTGGRPRKILGKVREHYPIALHGTSLSIGSTDPLHTGYLEHLKQLAGEIDPFIVSDHLCWCGVGGDVLHDLLPLPFTEEAIQHVVKRVGQVQEFLGRAILLENVSSYVTYKHSVIPEWQFLAEVSKRSGCGILLDLNNIYVNSFNHQFDPLDFLQGIPAEKVGQFHLAGHTDYKDFLFDTHGSPVIGPVWKLYEEALRKTGPVSTLIEWDAEIPPFEQVCEEAGRARKIYEKVVSEASCKPPEEMRSSSPVIFTRAVSFPSLSDTQEWLRKRVQPAEREKLHPEPEKSLLHPQGGVSGEERMNVYAAGYLARIEETLTEVYEAVHRVLGHGEFHGLCRRYAHRFPSRSYNLNYAGLHFSEFVKESNLLRHFPYLGELAKMEWSLWGAFHAFDQTPLTPEKISGNAAEDWENVRFIFQPSVRLFNSGWPLLNLWLSRNQEKEIQTALAPAPERILIARREDQVRCEILNPEQNELIQMLLEGKSLGQACEKLAEHCGGGAPPVAGWFTAWVHDGLILRLEFPKSSPL